MPAWYESQVLEFRSARDRRAIRMPPEPKLAQNFSLDLANFTRRAILMDWIAYNTSGEYFLGPLGVYFFDEKDAMAFKLYDVARRLLASEHNTS